MTGWIVRAVGDLFTGRADARAVASQPALEQATLSGPDHFKFDRITAGPQFRNGRWLARLAWARLAGHTHRLVHLVHLNRKGRP